MNAIASADVRDRWTAQPCDDTHIVGIEHARFSLTVHAGHSCAQFLAALGRGSAVMA